MEYRDAVNFIVKNVQAKEFLEDIKNLRRTSHESGNNKLVCLNSFLDDFIIIRVGGRLRHSNTTFDNKHQMLLSSSHTDLKKLYEHLNNFTADCKLRKRL